MFHESCNISSFISGNDAVGLLELIHECLSCKGEDDFRELFPKLGELFPYDFAASVLGLHDNLKGPVIIHGINISFPEEWVREYYSRNFHQISTVLRENFMTYKLQYIDNTWGKCGPQEIISLCKDFGIRTGYYHGSRPLAPEQYGSIFTFAGSSMTFEIRTAAILELLVPHLHMAYSRIFNIEPSKNNKTILSTREREVLDWLKQGKSSWEISVILSISESTVNYHVYNIMRKLGAVNRPQAVAIATHMGIIALG